MDKRVEIELLTNLNVNGEQHQKGDVLEVPGDLAAELIAAGSARIPVAESVVEDELSQLRDELLAAQAEKTGLQDELEDLRGELNAAQSALSDKSDEAAQLEKELHTLKTQHTADKAEIKRLQGEIQTMQRKAITTPTPPVDPPAATATQAQE